MFSVIRTTSVDEEKIEFPDSKDKIYHNRILLENGIYNFGCSLPGYAVANGSPYNIYTLNKDGKCLFYVIG